MNHIKELTKVCTDFQKYRRLQAKLVKLRTKKASPANVKPMQALLAQINGHLKDMDANVLRIMEDIKTTEPRRPAAPEKLPLVN